MNNYYVYVYIDPRNLEEFYFGKGRGSRKDAHLSDTTDSEKARRIAAIQKAGLKPIIRVIARDLSEHDALLVEKTLLWKLGRQLTNISSGHYSENFRSHNTLHLELSGFDYQSGIYYYNVGEGPHRNWDDYRKYGFISAGQGVRWRDAMLGFQKGDVVAAYLKRHGFVGIGVLTDRAKPIRSVTIKGKPLLGRELICTGVADNLESDDFCEYVAPVKWVAAVERSQAKWKAKAGIYTTTHVRASLDGQPKTIAFLEKEFGINVRDLVA
ncbi:MAG: GIY-YIG nuclease family protein [Candidatus Thiodiazotropha endolucinida]